MARRRQIAASPVRSAAEAWGVIGDLVASTLSKSPAITDTEVKGVMDALAPAGIALVASGYTESKPIHVVACPLYLTMTTVGGEDAFSAMDDENLNPVPGAATADEWTVYLPKPDGLSALVEEVVRGVDHASTDDPPTEPATKEASADTPTIDLSRLDPRNRT